MSIHGSYDRALLPGTSWSISPEGLITGVGTKFTRLQVGFTLFFNYEWGMTGYQPGSPTLEAKITEIISDTQLKIDPDKAPNSTTYTTLWNFDFNYFGATFNMSDVDYRTPPKYADTNFLTQLNTTPQPSVATLAGIDATEMTQLASNPVIPVPAHTGWNVFKLKIRDGVAQFHCETLVAGGISGDVDMY